MFETAKQKLKPLAIFWSTSEAYQLNPKYLVGDQGFMGTELEAFYNRKNIRPITLGPGTPWPNRAVRMYKKRRPDA